MDGSIFMLRLSSSMEEYTVVRRQSRNIEDGLHSLENLVNEKLRRGWTLVGGHCVTCFEMEFLFTQAMKRVVPMSEGNQTTYVSDLNNINRMRG